MLSFGINYNRNLFEYDFETYTILLPKIIFNEFDIDIETEKEYNSYKYDLDKGNIDWAIDGLNHEYLHYILHKLIGIDVCLGLDFLNI